tara:strand:- start:596 stop:1033 length:438 start_codon:yes stop_codon:yes gene_type:complete
MTNVSTLGNTTVMLDQLFSSYAEILEQAKQQLESVDITDSHVASIASTILDNSDFQRGIAVTLTNRIISAMRDDESAILDRITAKVLDSVEKTLDDSLTRQLNNACAEFAVSPTFQMHITSAVSSNTEIKDLSQLRSSLRAVLKD